jgi:magnesium-transporting ATPase (P-type)
VIELCTSLLSANGEIVPLLPEHKENLKTLIDSYAVEGYRTLCLAYRDLSHFAQDQQPHPSSPSQLLLQLRTMGQEEEGEEMGGEVLPNSTAEEMEKEMVWLGVFAIEDPLRPEVPTAVADCQRAGVVVRMVTGDNPHTALTIARRAGIVPAAADQTPTHYVTMVGSDFAKLSDVQVYMHLCLKKNPT